MQKKVAVVTGASQGVGKAIAEHLAATGYFVVLLARSKEKLKNVCKNILEKNGEAVFYNLDVSQSEEVQSCIYSVIEKYGCIDLLVNNAAILKRGTSEMPVSEIDELLKINLNGAIYVACEVAAQMKKQKSGYIINISSLGGKTAASFSGIYAASKFGLNGFSEALSKELSAYGVKVTSLCPSMIATEMAEGRKFKREEMIQLEDLVHTIDYLLKLSPNAVPVELSLSCLPLIAKTTEAMLQLYLA